MEDFQIEQINQQIQSTFRSPAAAEKFNQLVAEKDALIQRQSSGEFSKLQRQLRSLEKRKIEIAERSAELSVLAPELITTINKLQAQLEFATGELNAVNFELATLANRTSQNRVAVKDTERQLKQFESNEVSE